MSPPRIIFVNRVYWPSQAATAQLLTDLAEGLAARGWVVHVIAAGRESGVRNGVVMHRTGEGEQHRGLWSRTFNYRRFTHRARELLVTLAQPGDVVVPMTDPPLLATSITAAMRGRGGAVVPWIQDIYPEILTAHLGVLSALPFWPVRLKRDAAWQAARRCVTLGAEMRQHIAAHGVPAERIALIPNWAPKELHTPPSAQAIKACRDRWQVADQFIIAYSGNLGRVHEFDTILAAAERLRKRTDIIFLFIGTGARFEQIRKRAETRNLGNIRLLPPESRENLAAALAGADAHMVTLKPAFDGLVFPSKLAGVLAVGRPVLYVGRIEGEIARLLAVNECGVTTAPGEEQPLAEIITQWQKDPAHCRKLGQSARAAYDKHFTFAHALSQWEAILQQAAALP